jgi:hypothetical protein
MKNDKLDKLINELMGYLAKSIIISLTTAYLVQFSSKPMAIWLSICSSLFGLTTLVILVMIATVYGKMNDE